MTNTDPVFYSQTQKCVPVTQINHVQSLGNDLELQPKKEKE